MSQINSEAGLSSTVASSRVQQRTFDYAFSNVDQNVSYSYSEFRGKTYSGPYNSATLYYYYPWDGGSIAGSIWGWSTRAAAAIHAGLYHNWSYTVYFNGSLTTGTDLFIDVSSANSRWFPLIDAGFNDTYPSYGSPAYYFIDAGTYTLTCRSAYCYPSTGGDVTNHAFQVTDIVFIGADLGWSFLQNAASGNLLIQVNSSTVVNQNGNNSGTVTVQPYDNVDGTVSGTASYPLLIQVSIQGFANGSYYYYDDTQYYSASVNHFFVVNNLADTYSVEGESYQY
jgi:hypothetical protein